MRTYYSLILALIACFTFILPAQADVTGAQAFIEKMTSNAVSFLGDPSLSDSARRAEFRELLNSSYDMETIGRFSLGRYWKTAMPAQRTEYQRLFKNMIVEVYSRRFKDYNGQKIEVRGSKPEANGKDVIVNSFIVPESGPEIQVDWRVRQKGNQYKIVDVVVQGVSMALTQRADFASVIQRGGGDLNVLLEHLRNPAKLQAPDEKIE